MSEPRTLTCEEALRMLAEHLDGELDDRQHQEVEGHLSTCRSCFSRAEFERRLKAQMGGLREKPVQADFEMRMRALIGRFTAAEPRSTTK